MRIEITSGQVESRSGKIKQGDRAGQEYSLRQQEAYVHNGHAYPERIVLSLATDHAGYSPGFYTLAPDSFRVGEYGRLELARNLVLVREAEAPKLAVAAKG